MVEKNKKSLDEKLSDAIKRTEKIKKDIVRYKKNSLTNFFFGITEDKDILNFFIQNAKNKDIQEKIYIVIKKEVERLLNNGEKVEK